MYEKIVPLDGKKIIKIGNKKYILIKDKNSIVKEEESPLVRVLFLEEKHLRIDWDSPAPGCEDSYHVGILTRGPFFSEEECEQAKTQTPHWPYTDILRRKIHRYSGEDKIIHTTIPHAYTEEEIADWQPTTYISSRCSLHKDTMERSRRSPVPFSRECSIPVEELNEMQQTIIEKACKKKTDENTTRLFLQDHLLEIRTFNYHHRDVVVNCFGTKSAAELLNEVAPHPEIEWMDWPTSFHSRIALQPITLDIKSLEEWIQNAIKSYNLID